MLRRMLPNFGKLAMGASRSRGAISQLLHPCTMESQLECECCRRKMRMSGLCKVEMSAFLRAGGPYGRGADRVECEGAGAVEGVARDPTRTFAADRWRTPIATERSSGAAFTAACAQRRRWRAGAWAARPSLEPQDG